MSLRDREVLDLLRDEPELLALADAVSDTQRTGRASFRPSGRSACALAGRDLPPRSRSPWDRGGGGGERPRPSARGDRLERPVVHLTMGWTCAGRAHVPSVVTEASTTSAGTRSCDQPERGQGGRRLHDGGRRGRVELLPGPARGRLLYKQALVNGDPRIVGQGVWEGRPVYWLSRKGWRPDPAHWHRPRHLQTGDLSRPEPRRNSSGAQVAILGFDYAPTLRRPSTTTPGSSRRGGWSAPIVVRPGARGRVPRGRGRRDPPEWRDRRGPHAARRDLRPDGQPERSPIREALVRSSGPFNIHVNAIANKDRVPKLIGFASLSRMVKGGRWVEAAPVTIQTSAGSRRPTVRPGTRPASRRPGRARPSPVGLRSAVTPAARPRPGRREARARASRGS